MPLRPFCGGAPARSSSRRTLLRDLAEHVPRLGGAGLGDVAVTGRSASRLAYPRVEAEVADELARRGEAADVADRGHERGRRLHVDAGDAHQPQHLRPGERLLGDLAVEDRDLGIQEVDLAQAALEGETLVGRELKPSEPAAASLPEGVRHRRALAQVARQDSMRLILRSRPRAY